MDETMDEPMDDNTKDPENVLQRNAPAAESEDTATESMDESTDHDTTTSTPGTPDVSLTGRPERWDQMTRNQRKKWKRRHNHGA